MLKYWFKSDDHRKRWASKCPANKEYNLDIETSYINELTFRGIDEQGHPICNQLQGKVRPFTSYERNEFLTAFNVHNDEHEVLAWHDPEPFEFVNQVADYEPLPAPEPMLKPEKPKKVKTPRGVKSQTVVHINKTIGSEKGAKELIKYLEEVFGV